MAITRALLCVGTAVLAVTIVSCSCRPSSDTKTAAQPPVESQSAAAGPTDTTATDGDDGPPESSDAGAGKSGGDGNADPAAPGTDVAGDDHHDEAAGAREPHHSTDPTTEQGPAPAARALVFAPDFPLLVDLHVSIEGQAAREALDQMVSQLLTEADADGDGQVSWDELMQEARYRDGRYGNPAVETPAQRRDAMQMYDINLDGQVQAHELVRFVTSNAGGGQAIVLRTNNQFRGDNRTRAPLRRILDADDDGQVSVDEASDIRLRLTRFDADEDEILLVDDLTASTNLGSEVTGRRYGPEIAVLLTERTKWDALLYTLQEHYSYGGALEPANWADTPQLFQTLDANADQQLAADELPALLHVKPHVVLKVAFAAADGEATTALSLELRTGADFEPFDSEVRTNAGRGDVVLAGMYLQCLARNDDPAQRLEGQVQAQFTGLDEDANGYLDEDELEDGTVGDLPAEFDVLDADADGKLYPAEIKAYLMQQQAIRGNQVTISIQDEQDAWFHVVDGDHDGRLTRRELDAAAGRLSALDKNQDGRISPQEIPGCMRIAVLRGDAVDVGLAPMAATEPDDVEVPAWFRHMDVNDDGEVSRREFLGNDVQFRELDVDGDEFIERDELQRG